MTIRIVTDSATDLPPEIIRELDITVVPVYLLFGKQVLSDRVDITEDDLYQRLQDDPIHPTTTQPTPKDFAEVYQRLSQEADNIISIHISGKLSGTYNSAMQGAKLVKNGCPIDLVDSHTVSTAAGLVVIAAATMAKAGKGQQGMLEELKKIIPCVKILVLFDTLKYLAKGGRIGKAKAFLGSVLNVKPILTIKDDEFVPVGQVRSRSKGIEKLFSFIEDTNDIQDLAVIYSTTPEEAKSLADRAAQIIPKEKIMMARLGPALGVHGGPGVLAVAIRGLS
jgi:DegV family protein with EDD domain